jgi:hypothetical protein
MGFVLREQASKNTKRHLYFNSVHLHTKPQHYTAQGYNNLEIYYTVSIFLVTVNFFSSVLLGHLCGLRLFFFSNLKQS